MALIKCHVCSTEVSDRAAKCVKCGAPLAGRTAGPAAHPGAPAPFAGMVTPPPPVPHRPPYSAPPVFNKIEEKTKMMSAFDDELDEFDEFKQKSPNIAAWVLIGLPIVAVITVIIIIVSSETSTSTSAGSAKPLDGDNAQLVLTSFEREYQAGKRSVNISSSKRYQYNYVTDARGEVTGLKATTVADKGRFTEGSFIRTSYTNGDFKRCAGNGMYDGGEAFAEGLATGFLDGVKSGGLVSGLVGGAVKGIAGGIKDEIKISSIKKGADGLFPNFFHQRDKDGNILWCGDLDRSGSGNSVSASASKATASSSGGSLSGAGGGNRDSKLVGKWRCQVEDCYDYMTFNSDGTFNMTLESYGTFDSKSGTWRTDESKMFLASQNGEKFTWPYNFSGSGFLNIGPCVYARNR